MASLQVILTCHLHFWLLIDFQSHQSRSLLRQENWHIRYRRTLIVLFVGTQNQNQNMGDGNGEEGFFRQAWVSRLLLH